MEIAAKRKVDVVLVWRFDRFARSVKHLVTALEQFRSLGIEFISYQDNIDTSTPTGKMTFNLIAAIAEFERELIRERILSGLSRVRSQGKILGRPKKTQDVDRIKALHAEGKSLRAIAKALGISKNTVAQLLSL